MELATGKAAIQGTKEWNAYRDGKRSASDAPAMLSCSAYKNRNDLIKEVATGERSEVDSYLQYIFDKGHFLEECARTIIEKETGEALYTPVGSIEVEGMILSASLDGIDMGETFLLENKTLNEKLASVKTIKDLDKQYKVQMTQQSIVSGVNKCLFTATNIDDSLYRNFLSIPDGTPEKKASFQECVEAAEKRLIKIWYEPTDDDRQEVINGWKQFEEDLASYEVKPEVVEATGTAIEELPTLAIQLTGEVQTSNLDAFKAQANALLSNVRTDLVTDQHFADADKIVKFCGAAEKDIDAAKKAALAQTASIEELFRGLDHIKEQLRDTRLALDKKVKAEKANRKQEILSQGEAEVNKLIDSTLQKIGHTPDTPAPDLKAAAKNKRNLESLQNAVDSAIAEWKIAFKEDAATVARNVKMINKAREHKFLFRDIESFINKDSEFVEMLITKRINEYNKRINEYNEAEKAKAEAAAASSAPQGSSEDQSKAPQAPIRERYRAAMQAFVEAGLSEELAKTVVKLVAIGKVPGMVMDYP